MVICVPIEQNGKITLTQKDLQALLDQSYAEGILHGTFVERYGLEEYQILMGYPLKQKDINEEKYKEMKKILSTFREGELEPNGSFKI